MRTEGATDLIDEREISYLLDYKMVICDEDRNNGLDTGLRELTRGKRAKRASSEWECCKVFSTLTLFCVC